MPEIKGVAHFSIPVSDVDKSTKFYTEIVGCKFLSVLPNKSITFLDAGGVCVLLIKRPAPINKPALEMSDGVHHAFMVDAALYQSTLDFAARQWRRNLFRGRPSRWHDRRTTRLFPRSRWYRAGVHQSNGIRPRQVTRSRAIASGVAAELSCPRHVRLLSSARYRFSAAAKWQETLLELPSPIMAGAMSPQNFKPPSTSRREGASCGKICEIGWRAGNGRQRGPARTGADRGSQ